jgi:uncharacterized membrane protein YgcG
MKGIFKLFLGVLLALSFILSVSCTTLFVKTKTSETSIEGTVGEKSTTTTEAIVSTTSTTEQKIQETSSQYPEIINYVSDYAEIIDPEYETKINDLAADLEKKTTTQVFVVSVDSLEGKTIEKYALELFNEWGIGQKDKNNGVLLLIAWQEKKARIEVGYGLNEEIITNDISQKIFDEIIVPRFRNGEYGLGSYECVEKISELIISAENQ